MAHKTTPAHSKAETGTPIVLPGLEGAEPCEWSHVDGAALVAALEACSRLGWAMTLGKTSDGGALSICVLMGDQRARHYFDEAAKCGLQLRQWTEYFIDVLLGNAKS